MLVTSPKHRRPLNSNQITILRLCYKFRFVTTDLLSSALNKNRSTVYESLYVLEKQGYVHKFYDKTYRLRGRPAIYCLAAKGIKYLRYNTKLDHATLRNFYKNKQIAANNEELVDRCLLVFRIFNVLRAQTGGRFSLYTKYELTRDNYTRPLPELVLVDKDPDKSDYILDIFAAGTMTWLLRKRLRQHQDFADDSDYRYPNVLLVAGNSSTEQRLLKLVGYSLQDFEFYITQQELLFDEDNGKIWVDTDESEDNEITRVQLL